MGALFTTILRFMIPALAGAGATDLIDKVAKKPDVIVGAPYKDDPDRWKKTILFAVVGAVAAFLVTKLLRKIGFKLL